MAVQVIVVPELSVGDINGAIKIDGLAIAGRVTEVVVSTTWVALPAVALVNRNAMTIQNQGSRDVKLGYSGVGGYVGVIVSANSERFYNITDSITIYARTSSASTTLLIEELS
jgi:hypothetical protein